MLFNVLIIIIAAAFRSQFHIGMGMGIEQRGRGIFRVIVQGTVVWGQAAGGQNAGALGVVERVDDFAVGSVLLRPCLCAGLWVVATAHVDRVVIQPFFRHTALAVSCRERWIFSDSVQALGLGPGHADTPTVLLSLPLPASLAQ